MAGKLISDLNSGTLSLADEMEIDKDVSGTRTSYKTTVKDIVDFANRNVADEYDSTSTYAIGDYVMYESTLYKCITAVSSAENFDSTKWTSVVVTDEMGSGGGGGTGGHTIIDENGNSMTARAGLQFFGAVEVTDDSANNRTLVEVLGGDFYNPVIYSTEEREIGVWTDGKPLYQKSYTATITSGTQWIDTGLDAGDSIVESKGVLLQNNGDILTLTSGDSGVNAGINSMSVGIVTSGKWAVLFRTNNNDARGNLTLTLLYTKGTDTAGSGSWTPQGVPTHHYSTDEQIVGTWIDGSTLYERTVEVSYTFVYGDNDIELFSGVSFVSSDIKEYDVVFINNSGYASKLIKSLTDDTCYVNSSNKLILHYSCNASGGIGARTVRVTVRYTKSS